jgi:hypothetical protein
MEWRAGGLRRAIYQFVDKQKHVIPASCDLQGLCGGLLLSEPGGQQATAENAPAGRQAENFCQTRTPSKYFDSQKCNNGIQPRTNGQTQQSLLRKTRAGMVRGPSLKTRTYGVDPYCVRSRTTAALS